MKIEIFVGYVQNFINLNVNEYLFVFFFSIYLVSIYCVLGTVLGIEIMRLNEKNKVFGFLWGLYFSRLIRLNQ